MAYKLIVLAPSAGGKSTLLRYLREHTDIEAKEMDEEILKANDNRWPTDNKYKDLVLVPKITETIIKQRSVVYLASYIPSKLIIDAKRSGFKVVLLDVPIEVLKRRNADRMFKEKYDDVSQWFNTQLKNYQVLQMSGGIDKVIDGSQSTERIAEKISQLTKE